jgi:Glycosyltransferase
MSKGKIVYVASGRSFSSSAPPRKIKEVVECFQNEGYEVNFVAGKDLISNKSESVYKTIKHKNINIFAQYIKNSLSELADIIHDIKLKRRIEHIVKNQKPSLIWERSSRLHYSSLRVSLKYGIPYVLEWKDSLLSLYGKSFFKPFARHIEKYKVKKADYIVVESSKLANDLVKNEGIRKEKLLVAINAVNLNDFALSQKERTKKFRDKLTITEDTLLVTYIGSYAWYHDTTIIVEAAKEIFEKTENAKIKFLMVGDGPDRIKCIQNAQKYELEDKFIFLGRIEQNEVPNILENCDIAVLPDCLDIISPIKIQEYMSMCLPAVVPDYEANKEVIQNGVNGLLFKPKSHKDLSDKILYLYNNEDKRKEIGKNARTTIVENFTWDKTWGKVLNDIFSEIR